MTKISAYIVTLNEEKRLGKTLEALKQVADEIFVIDSGSTDKTKEIAESHGATFLFHEWKNISAQKHYGQELCHNDWVFSLDADEVLSPELITEIKKEMENPQADAQDRRPGVCAYPPAGKATASRKTPGGAGVSGGGKLPLQPHPAKRRQKAGLLQAHPLPFGAAHICNNVYHDRHPAPSDEQIAWPPQLGHDAYLCEIRRYVFGQRNEKVRPTEIAPSALLMK